MSPWLGERTRQRSTKEHVEDVVTSSAAVVVADRVG